MKIKGKEYIPTRIYGVDLLSSTKVITENTTQKLRPCVLIQMSEEGQYYGRTTGFICIPITRTKKGKIPKVITEENIKSPLIIPILEMGESSNAITFQAGIVANTKIKIWKVKKEEVKIKEKTVKLICDGLENVIYEALERTLMIIGQRSMLSDKLNRLEEKNNRLEKSNEELKDSSRKLEKSNEELKDSSRKLEKSNEELKEATIKSHQKINNLEQTNQKLEKSNEELREVIEIEVQEMKEIKGLIRNLVELNRI